MIVPTKHISTEYSLIGLGAILLKHLEHPRAVTGLWEAVRRYPEIATFKRFVLALDLLYAVGAIEWDDGLLKKNQRSLR